MASPGQDNRGANWGYRTRLTDFITYGLLSLIKIGGYRQYWVKSPCRPAVRRRSQSRQIALVRPVAGINGCYDVV